MDGVLRAERSIAFISVVAVTVVMLSPSVAAQQGPPNPNAQPGTRWTEEQIRQAVAPARVGRTLTPRAWADNARVAVCLSFDVDNESYLLVRGETSQTTLSAADFGAESGRSPQICISRSSSEHILRAVDRQHAPRVSGLA